MTGYGYSKYQWCKNSKIRSSESELADCQRFQHVDSSPLFARSASGQHVAISNDFITAYHIGFFFFFLKIRVKDYERQKLAVMHTCCSSHRRTAQR